MKLSFTAINALCSRKALALEKFLTGPEMATMVDRSASLTGLVTGVLGELVPCVTFCVWLFPEGSGI